jgi:class 3 adenylate cyclase/tetratricopeptide (TPR) repeat protein
MADKIGRWLESLGLGRYTNVFAENEITFDALLHLTEDDLKELGLPIGPRRVVSAAIAKLTTPAPPRETAWPNEPSASRGDAERRQLTILFCDLIGSTELSTKLDPEDMRDVLRAYQDACSREISRYDGYIAKFMGDGVFAYFGYPHAHEDDAERAINAGLGLVSAIKQLHTQKDIDLAVRVGIATGPVVVGDLLGQGAAQEAAVTGETPNLAGRLQSLAGTNAIVISDATYRLAGGMFECADLGKHGLKGFAEPVQTWSVLCQRHVESRFDATRSSTITELIGRDEEVEILLRRWRRAKDGEGQVVLITGEPGIGKSRLVRALQDGVLSDPHTRLRFQCSPYHINSALHPVIEQFERAAGFEPADDAIAKLNKLEALLALSGHEDQQTAALFASLLSVPTEGRYPALAFSPPQQKQRTLDALIQQLVGLAERQPVLFIFEDAHWVDPTTLELLERMLARLQDLPVLAVITYRPEFTAPWTGGAQVTLLTLNRLSRKDRMTMAERVAGGARLPEDVLDQIAKRTDGVPLFIEELTKSMLESGQLQTAVDRNTLSEAIPTLAIPDTLQDALMARLDRLASIKDILQVGACVGREFSFELLAEVSRVSADELSSALDQFTKAELIFRRGDPPAAIYTFKHALVQDAAYSSLLRTRRSEIHGTIANAIEATFPDTVQAQPEIVAHHFTEASLFDRAIPMWEQAGHNAAQKFANTEAIRHFNKAIELLASLPDDEAKNRRELSLQINLAPVYMAAKGFNAPEVGVAYARARDLAKSLEDTSHLFTSLWGLWLFNQMRPKKGTARALSEELLTLGAQNADSGQTLQACHASWTTNFFLGEFKYTRQQAEQGIALYDVAEHRSHKFLYGGHDPGVCCRSMGGLSTYMLGFPDQAQQIVRSGVTLAETINHPLSRVLAENLLVLIHLLRGDVQEAKQLLGRTIRLATESGIPRGMWADFQSGWATSLEGNPKDGLAQMLRDFDTMGAVAQEAFRPYYLGVLGDTCRAADRVEDGLGFVDRGLDLVHTHDSQWCLAELHRIKGELLRARGEPLTAVEQCFDTAITVARNQDGKLWELRATASLARLWHSHGRSAEARDRLASIYGWYTEGFDSADLKEAKALLEKLSNGKNP